MIEVTIESIKASLVSPHRVVVLKEVDKERYLPIWIGSFEAEAIAIELQGIQMARPLTHDLLKTLIEEVGAKVSHIFVDDLRNDTFYARIVLDNNGERIELDSRPSDAIALAVRTGSPMFVSESVMEKAAITPGEDKRREGEEEDDLSAFRDFVETLDLEDLHP